MPQPRRAATHAPAGPTEAEHGTTEPAEAQAAEAQAAEPQAVESQAAAKAQETAHDGGLRIPVPHLSVSTEPVHVPHPSLPHVPLPRPHVDLGSRNARILWIGGLAGVAALGVIDWPVAAAVAAGTYIAEQRARGRRDSTSR